MTIYTTLYIGVSSHIILLYLAQTLYKKELNNKSGDSINGIKLDQNTWYSKLLDKDLQTVSNSAYSQARDKLNYAAFEELANDASDIFYKK